MIRLGVVSQFRTATRFAPMVCGLLAVAGVAAVCRAEPEPVPAAVLEAEAARVAVVEQVEGSVLAVFSPSGRGGGSGVVISPDGFALTNYHVVKPCGNAMKCGMADGKLYDAVIVGIDPAGDVALIKLFGRDDFPVAELGDSDRVRLGDECFAMGNPFVLATDFQPTVTWGIVSGTQRYQYPAGTLLEYADCIQTDASINPGNSGGPLFDVKGRLIGINGRASFEKRGRINVGVAYAISINQIKHFLGHLHSGRIVDHATLGATVASDFEGNVVVDNILLDSDAYRRGLRYNSEILTFGGRTITTPNQFKNVLGIYPKGWRIPLSFRDEETRYDVQVRLRGLHGEEELIEKVSGGGPRPQIIPQPPKPESPDGESPDGESPDGESPDGESPDGESPDGESPDGESPDGEQPEDTPEPEDDGGSKPGDDPDAPEEDSDKPRRIQTPPVPIQRRMRAAEPMPEVAKEHFESKRGFANYYFNKQHQDRVLDAWDAQGEWRKAAGAWTFAGQLGGGGDFELAVTADGCRLKLPTTELEWTASERLEIDLAPPESGGFFPALLLWRKLAVEDRDSFDDLYYLGTAPLPGYEGLADVTVAQFRGVVAWFYHHPESGKLLGIDLFSDGDDADPCELRFLDYREVDGRQVPGRMEVSVGTDPYAEFRIDSWRFETREPEAPKG